MSLLALRRLAYRAGYPLVVAARVAFRARVNGAKCVLTDPAGQVLLVRHTYGDRRRWDLPGGLMARRETPRQAVVREIREELALEIAGARALGSQEFRFRRLVDTVHYFAAAVGPLAPVVPNRAELAEVRWFEAAALPDPLGAGVSGAVARAVASRTGDPGSPDAG